MEHLWNGSVLLRSPRQCPCERKQTRRVIIYPTTESELEDSFESALVAILNSHDSAIAWDIKRLEGEPLASAGKIAGTSANAVDNGPLGDIDALTASQKNRVDA